MSAAGVRPVRIGLRVAADTDAREAAIAGWLRQPSAPGAGRAIIVEGQMGDRRAEPDVPLIGLAAGCPCCIGLVALRVTLARTLRRYRPSSLLLLLRSEAHLPRLRRLLEGGELGVRFEVD